jgi:hypothetical protein
LADDRTQHDAYHFSRSAVAQDHDVAYLNRRHGIGEAEARQLIREHGDDWAKLTAAVLALRNSFPR